MDSYEKKTSETRTWTLVYCNSHYNNYIVNEELCGKQIDSSITEFWFNAQMAIGFHNNER